MPIFQPGQGLHSIRWRFAVAGAVLTAVALSVFAMATGLADPARAWWVGGLAVAGVGAAFLWIAGRLTRLVEALQRSTDAIADGAFDAPVEVDCACEIGGLANSFRKMRSRLNANVLRINTLAYTDAITGLPNRAVIDHLLGFSMAPPRHGSFRADIVFARFAVDEFVPILPDVTDRGQLAHIGERIVRSLAEPFRSHAQDVTV